MEMPLSQANTEIQGVGVERLMYQALKTVECEFPFLQATD